MKKDKTIEINELREDVFDHLLKLMKEIRTMDEEKVEEIAVSLGIIKQPINHIVIKNEFYPDDISHFFPDGTPDYIILEALKNVKTSLQERSSYDMDETLLCSKEDMYKALVSGIISVIEEEEEYISKLDVVVSNEDKEDFRAIFTFNSPSGVPVYILVHHQEGEIYESYNFTNPSLDSVGEHLLEVDLKGEEVKFVKTFKLPKQ